MAKHITTTVKVHVDDNGSHNTSAVVQAVQEALRFLPAETEASRVELSVDYDPNHLKDRVIATTTARIS